MRNEFMQFTQLNENTTELFIYGDIRKVGMFEKIYHKSNDIDIEAVSSFSFKDALAQVETDNLVVRINSNGGSVSEALSIYNLLKDFKGNITTKVDGFAASAASVIFMVGDKRIVPNSGILMIHNALTSAYGNANDFRKIADDLEQITQPSINIYVEKTGQPEETIKQLMDNETWIGSKQALELGFSTEEVEETKESEQYMQSNIIYSLYLENQELKKNGLQEPVNLEIDYDLLADKISEKAIIKSAQKKEEENDKSGMLDFFKGKKEN